jgi:uncharacterized protein (TIGR03435 family)
MKATLLIAALSSLLLQAQPVSSPAAPKFDVVSIKPCKPGVTKVGDSSPGRLSIGCALLADIDNTGLIQVAYNRYAGGHVNSFRVIPIEGGPDWIHSEMFEIDAKSDGHPSILMMQGPMMQAVLEDGFKLRIHRETRQGPVYELALGKGSPKLKPFQDGSCTPVLAGRPLPPRSSGQRYCRNVVAPRGSVDIEGGTLSQLAGLLGLILDRPVIDKTGITNQFEIHLVFSPDDSAAPRPATADPGAPAAVRAPDAPGIFQAIQEQLGLKLVPAKGPVDVGDRPYREAFRKLIRYTTLALDIESHILLQLGAVSKLDGHVVPTGHRARPCRACYGPLVQSRLFVPADTSD